MPPMLLGNTAYDRNYEISQLHVDWKYNRHLVEKHVFEHGYVLIRLSPAEDPRNYADEVLATTQCGYRFFQSEL